MDSKSEMKTEKDNGTSNPQLATKTDAKVDERPAAPKLTGRLKQREKRMRFQPENVTYKIEAPRHEYYKNLLDTDAKDTVEIPRAICVADRVEASVKEMNSMMAAVKQHAGNFSKQNIPRHMRRRAASHNRKRLPRRFHKFAELDAQKKKSKAKGKDVKLAKGKDVKPAPNRKKRRRKRDLQNEFQKRAGKHGWLETHIWHAKRFHMTKSDDPKYLKWGNRIALHPNDKGFRACYRAVAKHCLIEDISYQRCIQLSGIQEHLLSLFSGLFETQFDLPVLQGQKEIEIVIYKFCKDKTEKEYIGPAAVLWNPELKDKNSTVFMWLHPVIMQNTVELVQSYIDVNSLDIQLKDVSDEFVRFRLTGPKSSVTLLSILRPLNSYPVVSSENEKMELQAWMENKRSLISQLHEDFISVATDCHHHIFTRGDKKLDSECSNGSIFPLITDDPRLTLPLDKTTPSLTKSKGKLNEHAQSKNGEFPCDFEKIETLLPKDNVSSLSEKSTVSCCSPLWNETIRTMVSGNRKPDHVVSTRKHQQKYEVDETRKEIWRKSLATAVPVIAIRKIPNEDREFQQSDDNPEVLQPKDLHSGPNCMFGAGWDLILPKNWATAFWIPLIYNRARASGLRESARMKLESLRPHFPEDYPDTVAGEEWWSAESDKLATKYYKRPSAKRCNYSVLAVPNPFRPDWKPLLTQRTPASTNNLKRPLEECEEKKVIVKKLKLQSDVDTGDSELIFCDDEKKPAADLVIESGTPCANTKVQNVLVLRDKDLLIELKSLILHTICRPTHLSENPTVPNSTRKFLSMPNQLICVSVKALSKGIAFSRAMICVPDSKDIDTLCDELTDPFQYGLKSVNGPTEPKHWDPYRKERKEAKILAKKNKDTQEKILLSNDVVKCDTPDPPKKETLLKPHTFPILPSREIMGYVTSGDFLFTYAIGAGVGFVTLKHLMLLAQNQANHERLNSVLREDAHKNALLDGASQPPLLGLVRCTDCVQYRFVKLEIIKPH